MQSREQKVAPKRLTASQSSPPSRKPVKQNSCGLTFVYGRRFFSDLPLEYIVLELILYLSSVVKIIPKFKIQIITFFRKSSRGDFVFSADRLIRLVVEEGLNQLPYTECTVTTPTGHKYEGVRFEKGNCGVSIMRSDRQLRQSHKVEIGERSPTDLRSSANRDLMCGAAIQLQCCSHYCLCPLSKGAKSIIQEFPEITILTTEVHPVAPTHFGQKYFGTD
ncbi:uracil phosphoribosyltransferase homolog [Egretta garzetta]|uniref:uracil phosphoribosyltransferase homolog n=1 Tax=Egretta garzetta TaxID=188379 RepID=UPI00163C82ED|nr:uracil phosphoribosyltransferase homolog [Egretta garzetta]